MKLKWSSHQPDERYSRLSPNFCELIHKILRHGIVIRQDMSISSARLKLLAISGHWRYMADSQTLKDDMKKCKYINLGRRREIYTQTSRRYMTVWCSNGSWPAWEFVFHGVQDLFDEEYPTSSSHTGYILVNIVLKTYTESAMFFKQRSDCYHRKILSVLSSSFLTLSIDDPGNHGKKLNQKWSDERLQSAQQSMYKPFHFHSVNPFVFGLEHSNHDLSFPSY